MKLDFARNAKRNMVANALSSGIKLVFPFLNRTLFLWLLGPAYLGLNGVFTSVLGVLMLAELGFGTAIVCLMYKPVAEDDRELLCAYLAFYRNVYRCVGVAIFVIGLCLLPFIGLFVHGKIPPDIDLHVLFVIHLVNTSASYFLFAYRGSVLGAHHRNDVITNIRSAVSVLQYIVVCLILVFTRNYYHYVVATVFFTVVQNILLVTASKRLFPGIEPRGSLDPALRRRVVSDIKSIFMHKVGGAISNSTDNLIISAILGLVAVAAYGNYYYVVTTVSGLAAVVYSSITGGFGNKIHTETKAANFALFMRVSRLSAVVVVWCAAMMAALYQPFIVVWTRNADHSTHLVRHALTPALMVLYFYVRESRQMLLSFKSAAGLWREDRFKPIVAGAVNLALSILLVCVLPDEFKLDGVIAGTILSFALIQFPWETHVVFTSFFDRRQARPYLVMQAEFALVALALCGATWGATKLIPLDGVRGLVVKAAVAAVASTAVIFGALGRDVKDALSAVGWSRRLTKAVLAVAGALVLLGAVILYLDTSGLRRFDRYRAYPDMNALLAAEKDDVTDTRRCERDGADFTIVSLKPCGFLPSGPAVLVYDNEGKLVDKSRDEGVDARFRGIWRKDRAEGDVDDSPSAD